MAGRGAHLPVDPGRTGLAEGARPHLGTQKFMLRDLKGGKGEIPSSSSGSPGSKIWAGALADPQALEAKAQQVAAVVGSAGHVCRLHPLRSLRTNNDWERS